jgi:hypothetical protein
MDIKTSHVKLSFDGEIRKVPCVGTFQELKDTIAQIY